MMLKEQETARLAKGKELEELGEWQEREDQFHLQQAKDRAEIRMRENRPQAIDVLLLNLHLADDKDLQEELEQCGLQMDKDLYIGRKLTLNECIDLQSEIDYVIELEKKEPNQTYWKCFKQISQDQIEKKQNSKAVKEGRPSTQIVSDMVLKQIEELMSTKNSKELDELDIQVKDKLLEGGPIDVEYWEQLLKSLSVWKSKSKVKEIHQNLIGNLSQKFKSISQHFLEIKSQAKEKNKQKFEEYDPSMSPLLSCELNAEDLKLEIIDELQDLDQLSSKRNKVVKSKQRKILPNDPNYKETDLEFEQMFIKQQQPMPNEEPLDSELPADNKKKYEWQHRFRPRKPRYYNRVIMGVDWNNFNKTHFNQDNPPPPVVQGYKFNIFYPDLIDKTKAPVYEFLEDPNDPTTCVLKFVAGAPYEDIAFRIVNRQWEYNQKQGFKCSFDRGMLQLHFKFKRQVYRR